MGSRAKPTSNLNNASNICTMHQISNMHHYLQVEKLREAGDLKPAEAEELESTLGAGLHVFRFILVVPAHKIDEKYVTLSKCQCITKV
jgi:hypothetical protein